jgi:hypothetical protein
VRALWNEGLCGGRHDGPQLTRISLGSDKWTSTHQPDLAARANFPMTSAPSVTAASLGAELPPRWGRRVLLIVALLTYARLILWAQAPLFDSCEPCDAATLRWLARGYGLRMNYLAFAGALLLPLTAIMGVLATILSRRFAGRPALLLLIGLLLLALLDLRLLAYW